MTLFITSSFYPFLKAHYIIDQNTGSIYCITHKSILSNSSIKPSTFISTNYSSIQAISGTTDINYHLIALPIISSSIDFSVLFEPVITNPSSSTDDIDVFLSNIKHFYKHCFDDFPIILALLDSKLLQELAELLYEIYSNSSPHNKKLLYRILLVLEYIQSKNFISSVYLTNSISLIKLILKSDTVLKKTYFQFPIFNAHDTIYTFHCSPFQFFTAILNNTEFLKQFIDILRKFSSKNKGFSQFKITGIQNFKDDEFTHVKVDNDVHQTSLFILDSSVIQPSLISKSPRPINSSLLYISSYICTSSSECMTITQAINQLSNPNPFLQTYASLVLAYNQNPGTTLPFKSTIDSNDYIAELTTMDDSSQTHPPANQPSGVVHHSVSHIGVSHGISLTKTGDKYLYTITLSQVVLQSFPPEYNNYLGTDNTSILQYYKRGPNSLDATQSSLWCWLIWCSIPHQSIQQRILVTDLDKQIIQSCIICWRHYLYSEGIAQQGTLDHCNWEWFMQCIYGNLIAASILRTKDETTYSDTLDNFNSILLPYIQSNVDSPNGHFRDYFQELVLYGTDNSNTRSITDKYRFTDIDQLVNIITYAFAKLYNPSTDLSRFGFNLQIV